MWKKLKNAKTSTLYFALAFLMLAVTITDVVIGNYYSALWGVLVSSLEFLVAYLCRSNERYGKHLDSVLKYNEELEQSIDAVINSWHTTAIKLRDTERKLLEIADENKKLKEQINGNQQH